MSNESSSWRYKQITAERDLSFTNFPNGEIKYKYRMPAHTQINLDKSFIRMRCKLSQQDGTTQLGKENLIAPNYLMAYNMFRQMYHCINGIEVGSIRAYVPEIAALRHRTKYPQSYKDKFLATSNFAVIDYEERLNQITTDGLQETGVRAPKRQSFHMLNQADGTHILGTEEMKVVEDVAGSGIGTTVQYRQAADAGAGAIDLTETELEVGDTIVFKNLTGQRRIITAIAAATLTIDGRGITAFGATDIEGDQFFYEKGGGKPSRKAQEFEIVFKPPMSIWHKDRWMPAHDLDLKLYPHVEGTYQKMAIETVGLNAVHGTNFDLQVQDMIMWCAIKDQKHEDGQFSCEYDDLRCQIQNITTTSNVDYHFIVDRDAHTFTVAFADENTQNDTRRSASKFKIRNDEELNLQRYYIQWNGRVLPDPYPDISKTSAKDFMTQRYYESIFYSSANSTYDVESLQDWQDAGPYYTHKFGKSDKQTEKVTVSTLFIDGAFGTGTAEHRPNLLLFDHFTRKFKLTVSQGKVREVYADRVN